MQETYIIKWIFFLVLDPNSLIILISCQATMFGCAMFRASNSPILIGCSNVNLSCYGITITTVQVKLHAFVDLLDLVY